ncbi:MAG: VWA domain-containing protein, partial [Pyrinomonadaceae bacterium]
VAGEGTRAGQDITVEVSLDAGVPLESVKSNSHEIDVEKPSASSARVRLRSGTTIPNKDFILKYAVAGSVVKDALLTHRDANGGYFTLIMQPPDRVKSEDVMPKELVFVLDTSGSMSGFPIEKAKETMKLALDGLYPQDTFNLITFAGDTNILFPEPVPATKENLEKAQKFLETREGGGGTEMMKAINAALNSSDTSDHVRIVCFMTDGYVGNDMEMIGEVQKHPNARVFSFGIGSSVNRFLLDKMAEYGRGEVEYVALDDDGSAAARRFHERVRNPLLTDISIDWGGLPVADVYPKRLPDLFSAKPVIITGRYTGAGKGAIRLRGRMAGKSFEREMVVNFPEAQAEHDVLATLWARRRVDDLMGQDMQGAQAGTMRDDLREAITQLGLEYRLLTQFTSFVAVEEMTVTDGGQPRRIEVPVDMPEGVSRAAVGEDEPFARLQNFVALSAPKQSAGAFKAVTKSGATERRKENRGRGIATPRRSTNVSSGAASAGAITADGGTSAPPPPPLRVHPTPKSVIVDADEVTRTGTALSVEEQKRRQVLAKLNPAIAAVVERLRNKSATPAATEARFVRDGKAEVQVWLKDKSPQVLAQLKRLGFEVVLDPQTSKLVIGRISIEKLEELAKLDAVRYVAPQM